MKTILVPNTYRVKTCVSMPFLDDADQERPQGALACSMPCPYVESLACADGRCLASSPVYDGAPACADSNAQEQSIKNKPIAGNFDTYIDTAEEAENIGRLRFHPVIASCIHALSGRRRKLAGVRQRRPKRLRPSPHCAGNETGHHRPVSAQCGVGGSSVRFAQPACPQDAPPFPLEIEAFRQVLAKALCKEQTKEGK